MSVGRFGGNYIRTVKKSLIVGGLKSLLSTLVGRGERDCRVSNK